MRLLGVLTAGALVAPLAADAQAPGKGYRIGSLHPAMPPIVSGQRL